MGAYSGITGDGRGLRLGAADAGDDELCMENCDDESN